VELKLGSIPLRVQGWFVLMTLLLGSNERNPAKLGMWVVVVAMSVVIHELGHALMGKLFGLVPRIDLHGMGGTTSFTVPDGSAPPPLAAWRRVAISLAGPFAGFAFAAIVVGIQLVGLRPSHPLAQHGIAMLLWVNIGWGIFNLLPMLPLDGGNVMTSILSAASRKNGVKIARVVSIAVAALIALYAVQRQAWWILYLGVLFAFQNVQGLRQVSRRDDDRSVVETVEKAARALDADDPATARALLEPALALDPAPELRQVMVRVYLASLVRTGAWAEALPMVERERALLVGDDLARIAERLREAGRADDAARVEALGAAPPPLAEFKA